MTFLPEAHQNVMGFFFPDIVQKATSPKIIP